MPRPRSNPKTKSAPDFAPRSRSRLPAGVQVLHEDSDLLVVEKPAGLLTVSTDHGTARTLYYALTNYVRKGQAKSRNRVFVVHRLDRDASGVLVFAKSAEVKHTLQTRWDEVEKKYLAIVSGPLPAQSGVLTSYLFETKAGLVRSTPDSAHGKLSRTAYTVLKQRKGLSLLEITLLTGRKHQIRVHLAEAGAPILGDAKYGAGGRTHKRLALHALSIAFQHPTRGKRLRFETQMPEDFAKLMGE